MTEGRRLAMEVGLLLRRQGLSLAVAESAAGGLVCSRLTEVPGSSAYFKGGFVAYDNEVKVQLLGVEEATLARHGAVSREVATEMAEGVRRLFGADLGLSETGIAGPGGGTEDKPVGLFYLALATSRGTTAGEHRFAGERGELRHQAATATLELLMEHLVRGGQAKVDEVHVVTCFLERNGEVAILRRSARVGTYRGRWAAVSGYIEAGVTPADQAWQELAEETGLSAQDTELVREGDTVDVVDGELQRRWVVHPFRFRVVRHDRMRLDWENTELRWVQPSAIPSFDTVPGLFEAWQKVAD